MSLLIPPCASAGMQPGRTCYQVLDISPDEQDPKVIEEAAVRCSGRVRVYQLTREPACTLLLKEIAQALNTLLDPVRRREYDLGLSKPLSPAPSKHRSPGRRDTPDLHRTKSAGHTLGKGTMPLVVGEGRACDVQLVYRRRSRRERQGLAG
jgi:hypothetical protein